MVLWMKVSTKCNVPTFWIDSPYTKFSLQNLQLSSVACLLVVGRNFPSFWRKLKQTRTEHGNGKTPGPRCVVSVTHCAITPLSIKKHLFHMLDIYNHLLCVTNMYYNINLGYISKSLLKENCVPFTKSCTFIDHVQPVKYCWVYKNEQTK